MPSIRSQATACPFSLASQLNAEWGPTKSEETSIGPYNALPGHPLINTNNKQQVSDFLLGDLYATDLEELSPHLWVMSTFSSRNVRPLNAQSVRGRQIMVTEDPRLHIVWIHDRIFVKPLPQYLLSHSFWNAFLVGSSSPLGPFQTQIRAAALGYVRTYAWLIQHESDFWIAKSDHLRLIPSGVTWEQFCGFIAGFRAIDDSDVSGRYAYGELRLTRLNLYAKVFLRKWYFERLHGQYSTYFARFYGPILFVFGILSTVLNAMQVEMAVEALTSTQWRVVWGVCRWFSVVAMILLASLSLTLLGLLSWMIFDEWLFALRAQRRRRRALQRED